MEKKRIAVVGATGYTGSEIVGILTRHPAVEIVMITSESRKGEKFSDVHPFFRDIVDMELSVASDIDRAKPDLIFLALPHGISMQYVKTFSEKGYRMVDFSGDFRLGSARLYEQWYHTPHIYSEGFSVAEYGLPELFGDSIRKATLVANPGCFPTGALLALAPLAAYESFSLHGVIIDSKTGVTGAGISPSPVNLFSNVNENIKAYGLKTHRHTIEIQHILERLCGPVPPVQFTPHLLPADRGILTTAYVPISQENISNIPAMSVSGLREAYRDYYRHRPFVRVVENLPSIKDVRGSNYCDIYVDFDERTGNVLVISVIDNLVRGAAGLAVQNMNLMLGLDETEGLLQVPLRP